MNIINPLLITNGVFISIYCLLYLKKFEINDLKYICPVEYRNPEIHQKILKLTNSWRFIAFYKYTMPFIHLWLTFLFYYFGYSKRRNETNIISSLIFTLIVINCYGSIANKDRYGFVIKENTLLRDYCLYLLLHTIITYIYFKY